MQKQYFIKAINYTIGPTVDFCIELEPQENVLNTEDIKAAVLGEIGFEQGGIIIEQNPLTGCQ